MRKQYRIKLHIQFFGSLCACAVVSILWFMLVHYDMLVSSKTALNSNPVNALLAAVFIVNATPSSGKYIHM